MQKVKSKHENKGATGATCCNYSDNQVQNVAPLYKTRGCYKGATACYTHCAQRAKNRLMFCESVDNPNVACSTLTLG